LNTPDSDEDYCGVYLPDISDYLSLKSPKEILDLGLKDKDINGKNTKEAIDCSIYEFKKFVKLCLKCNPNIIEMLFANKDEILYIDADFRPFLKMLRENCISKDKIENSFYGYANAQKKKMFEKTDNLLDVKSAYEFLLTRIDEDRKKLIIELINDKDYQKHFKFKRDYVMIGKGIKKFIKGDTVHNVFKKLERALDSYGCRTSSMIDNKYNFKFASHLFRLIIEGILLFEKGYIEYPLPDTEFIMNVKKGKYSREEITELSDVYIKKFRKAYENSSLTNKQNFDKINEEVMQFILVNQEYIMIMKKNFI
jgi:predicted nucleotidyltransferase